MSRLTLDLTDEEHRQLKTIAAFSGKSMKALILEKVLPTGPASAAPVLPPQGKAKKPRSPVRRAAKSTVPAGLPADPVERARALKTLGRGDLMDETDRIMANPAMHDRLLKSLNTEAGDLKVFHNMREVLDALGVRP